MGQPKPPLGTSSLNEGRNIINTDVKQCTKFKRKRRTKERLVDERYNTAEEGHLGILMPCATCERRRTSCDETRPRCAACSRGHLKCVYNGPPKRYSFQDETDFISGRVKRRKPADEDTRQPAGDAEPRLLPQPPPAMILEALPEPVDQFSFNIEQDWAISYDMMPNSDFAASEFSASNFAAWDQDFYSELLANTSVGSQFPQAGLTPESLDVQISYTSDNFQDGPTSTKYNHGLTSSQIQTRTAEVPTAASDVGTEDPTEVPEHVLAQHYSLNAVHRPDSKNWNFYMHFYNRFARTHPPVLQAIYASASAQLLYSKKLGSMTRAISYYDSCIYKLERLYSMSLPNGLNSWTIESLIESLGKLDQENLDVVIISLYFLALFDLTTTRPKQLRRILSVMPNIIRSRKQNEVGGTFQRISTWFLYLDTRASLFGGGDSDLLIYSIGDEKELAEAVNASQTVLQEEYSLLYPEEERARDTLSVPLILRILEIMVIFREISRHTELADDSVKTLIREKIDLQHKEIDRIDEYSLKSNKLSIYHFAIVALYNAVEIYFSRAFYPTLPLYSANDHATAILTSTEKVHRATGSPLTAIPHTKAWPLPLIFATIEVRDPIYRNWGLRKLRDHRRAGNHYVRSHDFVERVCAMEDSNGTRLNLANIMKKMGEDFIV